MKKTIITCDCCNTEIEEKDVFELDHYIHVNPDFDRLNGHVKVVDGNLHSTSQRKVRKDFCLPCYNSLMSTLFQQIKDRKNDDTGKNS